MSQPIALSIEQFQASDAPNLLNLSESIHWPHTLEDWESSLAAGVVVGHRDSSGRILSSAGIYCYGETLASLGLVIVHAESRRRGLAREAVLKCFELAGDRAVMLVATPDGEPLYQQLRFKTIDTVSNLIAPNGISMPSGSVRTMKDSDFTRVVALDREVFGADRESVLKNRRKQARATAVLTNGQGFAFSIPQRDRLVIGPIIAPDGAQAMNLIGFLAEGHDGPIRIDVPSQQSALLDQLASAGFEVRAQRPLMVKSKKKARLPGDRSRLFGFASLGFG